MWKVRSQTGKYKAKCHVQTNHQLNPPKAKNTSEGLAMRKDELLDVNVVDEEGVDERPSCAVDDADGVVSREEVGNECVGASATPATPDVVMLGA